MYDLGSQQIIRLNTLLEIFSGIRPISNQIIYLLTDMLLHDMGGELADGRSDFYQLKLVQKI